MKYIITGRDARTTRVLANYSVQNGNLQNAVTEIVEQFVIYEFYLY